MQSSWFAILMNVYWKWISFAFAEIDWLFNVMGKMHNVVDRIEQWKENNLDFFHLNVENWIFFKIAFDIR